MKFDDTEKKLINEKFRHLTEDELNSYHDHKLDMIHQALADAHLEVCLICEKELTRIKEERATVDYREVTAEDVALVKRVMQQMGLKQQPADPQPTEAANAVSLKERFSDRLRQIVESWQAYFMQQEAVRETLGSGEPIWEGQSKDGAIKAHARVEKDASLTIHFSSNDLSLEGMRFNVSLGLMNREITFQLASESEVYTKVEVTRYQLPINLADIKITPTS